MAKLLKDVLKGKNTSTKVTNDLGGYKPKAGDEEKFANKHEIEKKDHTDAPEHQFKGGTKEAPFKKQKEGVYEAKKAEDAQCNRSPKGTECPVHGLAECWSSGTIKEKSLKEVLSKKDPASKWIHDFVHSKNKKFEGKSTKDRQQQALAAYYAKQRNEEVEQIDELSPPTLANYTKKAADDVSKYSEYSAIARQNDDSKQSKDYDRLAKNRVKGIQTAAGKLAKEEVNIDESLKTTHENPLVTVHDKDGLHTHANLSTANKIFNTKVKHTDVHAGPVKTKDGHETKNNLTFAISKHHAAAIKEEAIDEAVKTDNEGHGYHGTVKAGSHEERGKKYAEMHAHVKKLVGGAGHLKDARQPNNMVKHFLDSTHGRHVADDPTDSNITSRFKHFKKSYKPVHYKEDLAVPLLQGDPPRGGSDEAAEMVKTELKALANKALHLAMQMPDNMHVEPWVQAKIATAKEHVSAVHDYMIYGDHDKEPENESDTPMTFPNMSVDVNTGQNV
jgi:hypothetical protein